MNTVHYHTISIFIKLFTDKLITNNTLKLKPTNFLRSFSELRMTIIKLISI